jgi:colanic acid/amylovoran biosynthesis glycosyltransferase
VSSVGYVFERFPSFGQTFCYREVAELVRQGVDVHVFSIRRTGDEPPQDWDPEIVRRVHYVPEEKELVADVERAIRRGAIPPVARDAIKEWGRRSDFLRLYQAAVIGARLHGAGVRHVHAHFAGMAARTAYWIAKFFPINFSFTAHANDIFAPRDFEISIEKLIGAASAVVSVSDFAVRFLQERYPAGAAKMFRVYNGIDVNAFAAATFETKRVSIVSVGRLIEKKGFPDLIAACAELRRREIDFNCTIIGDGPLESQLKEQIAASGLASSVQLTGPLPQSAIARQFAEARVFALPCKSERDGGKDNLPTVIMEAMAAGLPVVSTPIAGVPEMVQENVTGILVPPGDVTALADALAKLIADREVAQRLGQCGRELARAKFSIAVSVLELRKLFDRD